MPWNRRRLAYNLLRSLNQLLLFLTGLFLGQRDPLTGSLILLTFILTQNAQDYLFMREQDFTHRDTRKRMEQSIRGIIREEINRSQVTFTRVR